MHFFIQQAVTSTVIVQSQLTSSLSSPEELHIAPSFYGVHVLRITCGTHAAILRHWKNMCQIIWTVNYIDDPPFDFLSIFFLCLRHFTLSHVDLQNTRTSDSDTAFTTVLNNVFPDDTYLQLHSQDEEGGGERKVVLIRLLLKGAC